jgi:hypothetical protein
VLSRATTCLWKSFRRSRTRFRDRPETVRLHPGTGVHLHPGILFGIIPEHRSESSRNRVHLAPESPQFDRSHQKPYSEGVMDAIPITPERKAQLEEYAQRQGKDPAAALDEVLAEVLEWERRDYDETVAGVREAYEDVTAGRTRPADEFLEELRVKHGFPR